MKKILLKYKWIFLVLLLVPLYLGVSFKQILDKTVKKRNRPIEYLVVHYTANLNPGASAKANAFYLQKKRQAGTHYCIDDKETIQCTEEHNVAYAVGDRKWFGFIPKPWLDNKIKNHNSLSYEMCLGGGRNDSLIIDETAKAIGWQLVNKGFYNSKGEPDLGRVVRHHDVTGKHCPRFVYQGEWDQRKEDAMFIRFKMLVRSYAIIHLQRLGKVK